MDFFEAMETMRKGIPVESLVSYTTYEMSKEGLLAEGILVPFEHLTVEEANGEWRKVTIIQTLEALRNLSDDQVQQLLKESVIHYKFRVTRKEKI
ncbi:MULTISPECIES: hypothetical protein [Bacillus]|uniref:hypothetical protein n=1 Tax=Bacillus TaxID=1386 RepID=UPI000C78419F|nr:MULTISPECIES: hypothetical protein [Bacillus]MCP1161213.1 hypothetical protein [Bacillus infantis]PLR70538.1 hypothetical protein CYJ37_23685 [Bacillus sp. UMB0728]